MTKNQASSPSNAPFEDVFPIGNEDFPMLYVGLPYQLPLRSQSTILFACCFPERLRIVLVRVSDQQYQGTILSMVFGG